MVARSFLCIFFLIEEVTSSNCSNCDRPGTSLDRDELETIYNLDCNTIANKFKEIVSFAIILGFILNIIYVAHPNTTSYAIAFVLSLIALSPFVLLWRYRDALRDRIRKLRGRHRKADDVEALGLMSAGPDSESRAEADIDAEKGVGGGAGAAGKFVSSEET
jgi:hypothetical protein